MRNKYICIAIILAVILSTAISCSYAQTNKKLESASGYNYFIENKGQWSKEIRYLVKLTGVNAWITDSGIIYDFYMIKSNNPSITSLKNSANDSSTVIGHVVKMEFEGSQDIPHLEPKDKQNSYLNYFIGNDPSKWASKVTIYHEVTIKELYKGIDCRFYVSEKGLRYDFILSPDADLSQIRMKFEGQDSLRINEKGDLVIRTSLGDIQQCNLFAYQVDNGIKKPIECNFKISEPNKISFQNGSYDKDKQLIIDPLLFTTYLSGGIDGGIAIVSSSIGSPYLTGAVYTGATSIATPGAYQTSIRGSNRNCFVANLDASGTSLNFLTYIGGTRDDCPSDITLDSKGNIYITGFTTSDDYPTTVGVFKSNRSGSVDAFVTKLNSSGSALINSTYFGETGETYAYGIAVDANDNPFITGFTNANSFPTTSGAYQTTKSITKACFITKFNSTFSGLIYSTFIAGTNGFSEGGNIKLDANNNAYIVGQTSSTNFPVLTAYQPTLRGGVDCFVTKLNANGNSLVYSTYLGGSNSEESYNLVLDSDLNAYITGKTNSTNFPVSSGAYQTSLGGSSDCFVTKLNPSGFGIVYSTYLGGTQEDAGMGIAATSDGKTIVTGYTKSSNFPITGCPYKSSYEDCFVTQLNTYGTSVEYSTCIGGTGIDIPSIMSFGKGLAVTSTNNIYLTGYTTSRDLHTTIDAYQTKFTGSSSATDCFVAKFTFPIKPPSLFAVDTLKFKITCENRFLDSIYIKNVGDCDADITNATLSGSNQSDFVVVFPTLFPVPVLSGDSTKILIAFTPSTVGDKNAILNLTNNTSASPFIVKLFGRKDSIRVDLAGLNSDSVVFDLGSTCLNTNVEKNISIRNLSTIATSISIGDIAAPFELVGIQQNTQLFLNYNENKNITVRFQGSQNRGAYTQTILVMDSCRRKKYLLLKANIEPPVAFAGNDTTLCPGSSITIGDTAKYGTRPLTYEWSPTNFLDNPNIPKPTVTPSSPMQYVLKVTDRIGCVSTDTIQINLDTPMLGVPFANVFTCLGTGVEITKKITGGTPPYKYNWSPKTGLNKADTSNPIATPNQTTKYTVTITDRYGCSFSDSITVNVFPKTEVSVGDSIEICPNSLLQLSGTATGGVTPYKNIAWTPKTGLDKSDVLNPNLYLTTSGRFKYILSVTDQMNCIFSDTLIVNVIPVPSVKILGNTKICEGASTELKLTPTAKDYNYLWSTGEKDTVIKVNSSGKYWVRVQNKTGCWGVDTVEVNYFPKPKPELKLSRSPELCKGASLNISLKDKYISQKWNNGDISDNITVSIPGYYFVTVTDTNGCTGYSDTVKVSLVDSLNPKLEYSNNGILCPGGEITISAKYDYNSYLWESGEKTKSIIVSKPGFYKVFVTDAGGCQGTSEPIEIKQGLTPAPIINGDTILCKGESGVLKVIQDFKSYLWSTGDTTKSITIPLSSKYSVIVTDTNNCTGTSEIAVKDFELNITGIQNITFDTIYVGSISTKSITIKNESNGKINVKDIKLAGLEGNTFVLNFSQSLPAVLNINDTLKINVKFNPLTLKTFSDSAFIDISGPCPKVLPFTLKGNSDNPKQRLKTRIWIPDLTATVNDKNFCIPIMASKEDSIQINDILSFSAEIRFNPTVMLPNIPNSIISGERVINIKGDNIQFKSNEIEIGNFCGWIFLPDTENVPVRITNFLWSNGRIEKEYKDGSLSVVGICQPGIARIILSQSPDFYINSNPVSDLLEMTAYSASGKVDIYTIEGIKVLSCNPQFSASTDGTKINIDVSGLAQGIYFVKLGAKVHKFVKI